MNVERQRKSSDLITCFANTSKICKHVQLLSYFKSALVFSFSAFNTTCWCGPQEEEERKQGGLSKNSGAQDKIVRD